MSSSRFNRREFVRNTVGVAAAGAITPYIFTSARAAEESKNDRHVIGCIGVGDRWKHVGAEAMKYGDVVAVCDVDKDHLEAGNQKVGGKAEMFEDYRKILDNKKIDVVTIVTPDHWTYPRYLYNYWPNAFPKSKIKNSLILPKCLYLPHEF